MIKGGEKYIYLHCPKWIRVTKKRTKNETKFVTNDVNGDLKLKLPEEGGIRTDAFNVLINNDDDALSQSGSLNIKTGNNHKIEFIFLGHINISESRKDN